MATGSLFVLVTVRLVWTLVKAFLFGKIIGDSCFKKKRNWIGSGDVPTLGSANVSIIVWGLNVCVITLFSLYFFTLFHWIVNSVKAELNDGPEKYCQVRNLFE